MNAIPGMWSVTRWSGSERWPPRLIVATSDEDHARAVFAKQVENMRQGSVELIDEAGAIADRKWAPRLRSRW